MTKAKLPDRETQVRFLRFLVVGGSSALLQFVVLAVVKGRIGDTLAFSVSWIVSTAAHYLMNRFWALPSARHDAGKQFGEYLVTVAASYLITLGAFQLLHDAFGFGVMWATFWAIPPSTVVVFLLLNYRVFRRSSGGETSPPSAPDESGSR
jgi:putative flippase GtrA